MRRRESAQQEGALASGEEPLAAFQAASLERRGGFHVGPCIALTTSPRNMHSSEFPYLTHACIEPMNCVVCASAQTRWKSGTAQYQLMAKPAKRSWRRLSS